MTNIVDFIKKLTPISRARDLKKQSVNQQHSPFRS